MSLILQEISALDSEESSEMGNSARANKMGTGNWVLVSCSGKKQDKYYVGQIIRMFDSTDKVPIALAKIKFLKRQKSSNSVCFAG